MSTTVFSVPEKTGVLITDKAMITHLQGDNNMLRYLGVILALAMLLCGCVQSVPESTPPTENLNPPVITGLYVPDSDIEQSTGDAVRGFKPKGDFYGCTVVGDELLLMGKAGEEGTLSFYGGEYLDEIKTVSLGKNVTLNLAQMQIGQQGIGYFDSENKDVVFLNPDLVEIGRMHLPEELMGSAWLSTDWQTVYYCTGQGIHAMNLQSGISRLLKAQEAISQELTGLLGNGKVLRYEVQLTEFSKKTQLIDAETGLVMYEGTAFDMLTTQGDAYFLNQMDRGVRVLHFGKNEDQQILWPTEANAQPVMLFENNAIVMADTVEGQVSLSYYDLETGLRTASVNLNGVGEVWSLQGDGEKAVWMLGKDVDGELWIYHWDTTQTATSDTNDYTAIRYTKENPDTDGLAQIAAKATELGQKFGVEILIWKDAAATAPEHQIFGEEYMPQLYERYLAKLEQALSVFPEGFFAKVSGQKLKIALVQSISGELTATTLPLSESIQFYSGNTPIVAVTLGDDFERNLYHGVYLAVETRILSKSAALYEWFRLNPKGFLYDDSYITNQSRTDTTYLEGGNRHFIDLFSMSFAKEDRATIFEYACMPGNEEYFQTWVMQEKLKKICTGIREAYGLKKVEGQFLWEQYIK